MMSSNTRGGKVYEEAMCLSVEYLGKDKANKVLSNAIEFLKTLPKSEAVVTWDRDTVINAEEAVKHLERRRERVLAIEVAIGSRLRA